MTNAVDVIDAGIGNVASVVNMLKRVGVNANVVTNPSAVASSRKLVLPGVGAFDGGMTSLDAHDLREPVRAAAESGARILGICLGMQLMFEGSEEGSAKGLGLIPGRIERFKLSDPALKIPHMGWNRVRATRDSSLFPPTDEEQRFYFVHSYHAVCESDADVAAVTRHGYEFACAVERGNLVGVQFHPEKSHRFGMALLARFVAS